MKINRLLGIVTILSFGSLAGSAARAEERVRVALSVRNVVFLPFYYVCQSAGTARCGKTSAR
jgi:hypothetical protein